MESIKYGEKMTAFEKGNGFIEQLIYFECPADNEKSRLRAELALIEKTNSAELFQAIYDTSMSLLVNGIHCYLTGEAEQWFIFYFLDMICENPLEKEMPSGALSKGTFVIPQEAKEQFKRFAAAVKLPEDKYEIIEMKGAGTQ